MKPIEYLSPYLPYSPLVQFYGNTKEDYLNKLSYDERKKREIKKVGKIRRVTIRKNYSIFHVGKRAMYTKSVFGDDLKLILRPLSDLTKEIEHNGEKFVPLDKLKEHYGEDFELRYHVSQMFGVKNLPYELFIKLISWHFDVFSLHEKGQCIYYDEI